MSDFIKVNFKNGHVCVLPKKLLHLHAALDSKFYANDVDSKLAMVVSLIAAPIDDKLFVFKAMYNAAEITREEYDRLCKELGIDQPWLEMRIKDLEYSNKCLRHERDEAQRKYLEMVDRQRPRG